MIDSATILVVDDNTDDIEMLKRAFRKAGLDNPAVFLNDGDEAIEFLDKDHQDNDPEASFPLLMLLDLHMPRCSGLEVLAWIHRQPHLRNMPTIVFTDSGHSADVQRAHALGAHGYWTKPGRFEELVALARGLKQILENADARVTTENPSLAAV